MQCLLGPVGGVVHCGRETNQAADSVLAPDAANDAVFFLVAAAAVVVVVAYHAVILDVVVVDHTVPLLVVAALQNVVAVAVVLLLLLFNGLSSLLLLLFCHGPIAVMYESVIKTQHSLIKHSERKTNRRRLKV